MRTTLDLPDALVQEAMQVTRIKTKKQLVTRALEELIKRERLTELKQYQGKIDLNIDLDVLRGPCVTFLSIRPSGSAISEVAKVLVV
jgi:Arc/MetJ family transcription regulator